MAATIPARDPSAEYLEAGQVEWARAKGKALFESQSGDV